MTLTAVIRIGRQTPVKMEHTYARRAQAVTYSLHWTDAAIVKASSQDELLDEAIATVEEWRRFKEYRLVRAMVEGRGKLCWWSQEI